MSINSQLFNKSEGNYDLFNLGVNKVDYSNATVISDGYLGDYWNDGISKHPDITTDSVGNLHVVWSDDTDGVWGTDDEIMYANYTDENC